MQNILIFSLLTDLWADEGDGEAEFDLNCKEAGAGGEGSKMCDAGVKVAVAPAVVPGDEAGGEVTAEVADDAAAVVVVVAAVASTAAVWAAVLLWWYGLKYG